MPSMKMSLLLLMSWAAAQQLPYPLSNTYSETLMAQGLIGSHFGPPDTPLTYDYIIVGGGTAGLTVARRLAANTSNTVAVIEAGGLYEMDNGNFSEIPAFASRFEPPHGVGKNPFIDWYQETTPQPGLGGRIVPYTQGKTFGGGSARNLMVFQRSAKSSYDQWANEVGDDSYTFDKLLPFFMQSVQMTPPSSHLRLPNSTAIFNGNDFSPLGGPLQVSWYNYVNPISSWIALGMEAIGLKQKPAFFDGDLLGWAWLASSLDPSHSTRSSSSSSFLRESLRETTNLAFYKNNLAKKILFDNKRATGVIVNAAGVQYQLNATKEVIVSAGSFRSPQLLMVSGIGPKAILDQNSIRVVADMPGVGQNLQDNIFSACAYPVDAVTHQQLADPEFLGAAITQYNANRTGILENTAGDLMAFEKLPSGSVSIETTRDLAESVGPDWPEIEYLAVDAYFGDAVLPPPADGRNYAAVLAGLVAPFSRGNVSIACNDTAVNPIVNPNWLSDPRDREVALAGFKRLRGIWGAPAVRPILTGPEAYPGANVTSDEQIMQAIMSSGQTVWHAAGTNKMGMANDTMAVVDSHGKVFGIDGLRIVDASIMPKLVPGHPQGTVYALAEKIAHDIVT